MLHVRETWFGTRVFLVAMSGTFAAIAGCGDDSGAVTDAGPTDAAIEPDAQVFDGGVDAGDVDAALPDGAVDAGVDAVPAPAACEDPADADGDGLGGYPDDPGCVDRADDDESDDCPDGPGCPRCSNGVDDDADDATDYPADIGCAAAGHDDEANTCGPGLEVMAFVAPVEGNLTAGPSHATASCAPGSASSPEQAWALRVDQPLEALRVDFVTAYPDPLYQATLSLRDGNCGNPEAELTCNGPGYRPELALADPAPGTYYLLVEGHDGDLGRYGLEAQAIVPSGARCTGADYAMSCIPSEECDVRGDGFCHPVACSDGIDNDANGRADWPDDPACIGPSGVTELDRCPGDRCPDCANGIDDDLDGHTDYPDDAGCPFAGFWDEGPSCNVETDPMMAITGPVVTGTTLGATDDFSLETDYLCRDRDEYLRAPDVVHWLYLPGAASVRMVGTAYFSGLLASVSHGCDFINYCSEDTVSGEWEAGPGYLYVTIDGDRGAGGAYGFTVSGRYHAGEPCDPDQIAAGIMQCAELTACVDGACRY